MYLNPIIGNQGTTCISGWAFAAVATMESAVAIISNQSYSQQSVQYLIDCDTSNQGCRGGWAARSYTFLANQGYLAQSVYNYKTYQGVQRQCHNPGS